jgi:hypothetical protein
MHGRGLGGSRPHAGRGRTAATLLALALAFPATVGAVVVADGADTRDGAQSIEALPSGASALVDRPADQDWYSIAGRNGDDSVSTAFVRVLSGAPGCDALAVALFNPEGRWMRSATAATGAVATILVPGLPSRYSLRIGAVDAACSGLEYEVTYVATDPPPAGSTASRCLVARTKRAEAARRLRTLRARRARVNVDSRPRYDAYIAQASSALAKARRAQTRSCATSP